MDRFFKKKSSAYNKQCYINSKAVQLKAKANKCVLNMCNCEICLFHSGDISYWYTTQNASLLLRSQI